MSLAVAPAQEKPAVHRPRRRTLSEGQIVRQIEAALRAYDRLPKGPVWTKPELRERIRVLERLADLDTTLSYFALGADRQGLRDSAAFWRRSAALWAADLARM